MGRPYKYKYGTSDSEEKGININDLFITSELPDNINETLDDSLKMPALSIDLGDIDKKTEEKARIIAEKLSAYYFDQRYIDNHPYIPNKISQEIDNIRRLLKMLSINECAQDSLILTITVSGGKNTLYSSLTSLQNSMLNMQTQLNQLTDNLENIFKEMQENCDKTFEEKDKESSEDGSIVVRGSRDFIKAMIERKNQQSNKTETIESEMKTNNL